MVHGAGRDAPRGNTACVIPLNGRFAACVATAAAVALSCPVRAGTVGADSTPRKIRVADRIGQTGSSPRLPSQRNILRTRFVVGLEHKVDYQIFSLSNPNRVVVELPDINVRLPMLEENKSVGLVKTIRAGLAAPGKTRIVIAVTHPAIVESSKIAQDKDGQFRLALIIRPANAGLNNPAQKDFARPSVRPRCRRLSSRHCRASPKVPRSAPQGLSDPIIVLDPGHGGIRLRRREIGHGRKGRRAGIRTRLAASARKDRPLQNNDDTRRRHIHSARRADGLRRAPQGEPFHRDPCRLRADHGRGAPRSSRFATVSPRTSNGQPRIKPPTGHFRRRKSISSKKSAMTSAP